MKTVNMHEAKTHLSKLVAEAVAGEPFLIAKAGKPLVKVEVIEEKSEKQTSRLGFLEGQWKVPEDLDTFMQDEIIEMFYGKGDGQKFTGLDFPYPEPGDDNQRLRRPAGREKGKE